MSGQSSNTCYGPTSWEWPERSWARLHLDYAGPLLGRMFLVLVDAHFKWMEIIPVHAATSSATIEKLRILFATHGLPERVVTDDVQSSQVMSLKVS